MANPKTKEDPSTSDQVDMNDPEAGHHKPDEAAAPEAPATKD